ncbi:glycosyltransferase family 39 protein [Cognatiyoonia sp. IB215446]|uniref:glycosyltransferase family 39 protein n=1 Tax=Cognatiyoonia sp. IB215446 TaxID=3097355 RepID=UPI002A16BE91|nr:glycosyltransferase family 39 protein [Cognatiyoonia sp. IB215446]MDX8346643.1 glycosyltransferase family 39 protein [Cognatiyoonia sp. IB215446]
MRVLSPFAPNSILGIGLVSFGVSLCMLTFKTPARFGPVATFLIILMAAIVLRSWQLGHPAPWWDELHSLWYIRNSTSHLLDIHRSTDIHPPLYFLTLKGWSSLFGVSREASRALSVTLGCFALLLLFFGTRKLFSTPVALIAVGFFATFPTAVHYAREIRMYPLLTVWFLLSFLCFAYLYRGMLDKKSPISAGQRASWIAGFAVSLALSFYTHYTAALYFMLYTLVGLHVLLRGHRGLFVAVWGGLAIATLLVLPQMVQMLQSSLGDPRKSWMAPTTWTVFYSNTLGAYPYPGVLKLGILAILGSGLVLMTRRFRDETAILLFLSVGGMLLAAVIGIWEPIYLVRTIQVFTAFSGVFAAFLLLEMPRWLGLVTGAGLLALNIATVAINEYPHAREDLLVDRIGPLVTLLDPASDQVFAKSYPPLIRQMEIYDVPFYDIAQPISLANLEQQIPQVRAAAHSCMGLPQECRAFVLVVEADSDFEKEAVAAWNGLADELRADAPHFQEGLLVGFRVLALSQDPIFLSQVSNIFSN